MKQRERNESIDIPPPSMWPTRRGPRTVDVVDLHWRARLWRRVPSRKTLGLIFAAVVLVLVVLLFVGSLWFIAFWLKNRANWRW